MCMDAMRETNVIAVDLGVDSRVNTGEERRRDSLVGGRGMFL